MRLHTGERPFKCAFCPRAFTAKGNKDKHERRKHKDQHAPRLALHLRPNAIAKRAFKRAGVPADGMAPTDDCSPAARKALEHEREQWRNDESSQESLDLTALLLDPCQDAPKADKQ